MQRQTRIAVFGAGGYTGRLVVAELARRGVATVLSGRDGGRLAAAASQAGAGGADVRPADAGDAAALALAFRGCAAVVNCAGPFTPSGDAVARAAIAAGCHYVDTSGEQGHLRRLFDACGDDAARAGVAVVPGLTDDGLPGDLLAHLVAERAGAVDELVIAHRLAGGAPSRGTLRSLLAAPELLDGGALAYADGAWVTGLPPARAAFAFPGTPGPAAVVAFASPVVVTAPRHVAARRVAAVVETAVVERLAAVTPELAAAAPEGPPEDVRRAATFTIVAEADDGRGRRVRGIVEGSDLYGTTAVIAAEGARRLVAGGAPAGVLAPAQAYDPAGFLGALAPHGVRWEIERATGSASA
jgi:short subunit dehydrogenase-like uncharacterized protein